MRWVNELADFEFKFKYPLGKLNTDADYLSRRSLDIDQLKAECTEEFHPKEIDAVISGMQVVEPVVVNAVSAEQLVLKAEVQSVSVQAEELQRRQMEDEVVGPVLPLVVEGRRPKKL